MDSVCVTPADLSVSSHTGSGGRRGPRQRAEAVRSICRKDTPERRPVRRPGKSEWRRCRGSRGARQRKRTSGIRQPSGWQQVPLRLCKGPEENMQEKPGDRSEAGTGREQQKMVTQRQRERGRREKEGETQATVQAWISSASGEGGRAPFNFLPPRLIPPSYLPCYHLISTA